MTKAHPVYIYTPHTQSATPGATPQRHRSQDKKNDKDKHKDTRQAQRQTLSAYEQANTQQSATQWARGGKGL